ncbi:T9SS type A sorting domain-containing protein [Pseudochryseolinea flava]|uniref:Secretion system C-terminal sorting domain-containing protein n=1 Tax=Pseudochryseolinea flava TaxID=2059302 RepID=A0A364Y171_9BACT|nr:T9SS type A sorting domain-containing protein [Pseudochryseolinea flava]RAW00425.1 hypothetical protein DQQ10_15360 [Pseudochryseolinea flava]
MYKLFTGTGKSILLLVALVLVVLSSAQGQTTYYSRGSGSWNDVNTWSVENHAGAVAPQIPGGVLGSNSTDIVIIAAGHNVVLDIDREISGLTVGTPVQTGSLIFGNDNVGRRLNVRGPVSVDVNGTLTRNTGLTEGIHTLAIQGDNGNLTNNGVIDFTDLARPGGGWTVVNLIIEIGGNVALGGTAALGNSRLNSLTVNKNNRSIKLTNHWTVADRLYIIAGYLELGDNTTQYTINGSTSVSEMRIDINGVLRIYGTAAFPTGYLATIDGADGTIEYAGAAQSVAAPGTVATFPNLLFSGSGIKSLTADVTIANNLTISSGVTLQAGAFKINLSGNYVNNGTFTPGTGTVKFMGSVNQTITGTANFTNLEIAMATTSVGTIVSAGLSVSASTAVVNGTLDLGTITTHTLGTVTGAGTIALSATVGGTTTFPAGTFTSFLTSSGTGTVAYNGTVNYNIGTSPLPYAYLIIQGASTKTMSASIQVTKDLTIESTATLATGANTIALTGNFINNGTLAGSGTVNFNNATANQSITGTSQTTFNNLTVSKASGLQLILGNATRVNGTLALANAGVVNLDVYNLTIGPSGIISGNAGGTAPTDFSSTRMILQDGTNSTNGVLIRESTTATGFQRLYPIGTGTIYSYAQITQLGASISGTASIAIKAIPFSTTNDNIVKRYWYVKTTNISAITNARITFKYDASEITISGTPTLVVKRFADNVDNDVTGSFVDNTTTRTFGVNAAGNTFLESEWRAGDASNFAKTYYSYQSGSWDVPNNWTTDPTGTILQGQPGAGGPNNGDRVIILNGRTMFMASANKTLTSLEIESGGTLDIKTFGGHNFGTIRGAGLLRIATTSVPTGNFLEFVSPVGGTVEYYDYTGGLATNIPYYNNVIMSGTGNKVIGGPTRTIVVNGNFSVTGGTATIGSGAGNKLTVNIFGNVTISSGAMVAIGNDQIHELNFYQNLVANGSIDLSNAVQYADATGLGAAILTMKGASDNTITGAATKFDVYKLIVDKGVDQTYILDMNATNFALYAPTQLANGSTTAPYSAENPEINKALWVKNGTLKLGSSINIPRLSTGGNDFFIPERGAIWLNGATVATYDAASGSPGNTGLTLYGKLRVSSGNWNGNGSAGIVYRTISEIIIEGGTVTVSQLRASTAGTGAANNRSAYVQSGGEFIVTGTGENNTSAAQFSLDKTSTIFRMSGGTIRVRNATLTGAIDIRADAANYDVTGGLVEVTTNSATSHLVRSTVPFYNFTSIKGSGIGNVALTNDPLVVLNDFVIGATAVFNANNLNLTVGRNFNNQGTYTTGTNTTIFNSSTGNQTVTSPSGLSFNNLTIANTFATGVVTLAGNLTTTVAGNLTLNTGTLNDGGETVTVRGNIVNNATHTGTGRIRLNNSVGTISTLSGSGNGVFQNLELNDADGAALSVKQTVNGVLTLTAGVLDLKQFNLTLGGSASISVSSPSSTKMIKTAGNRSDGGLTKIYPSAGTFTFPLGVTSKYTPVVMNVVSAANFGSITINPVNVRHPFVSGTNALNYYWEVRNTGFTGAKNISSTFEYVQGDVVGTETSYIGGFYDLNNPSTWTTSASVNSAANTIPFTNVSYLAGEYTAGISTAFSAVIVFYSRASGNWESPTTWSNVTFGGTASGSTPSSNNPVFIGDGTSFNHTVTVTTNTRNAGNLKLSSGSTLDLGTTTGHNFGAAVGEKIKGNGRMRISSASATAQFPAGDFGEFIATGGGTVEYYRTALDFKLPTTSASPTLLALPTYMNLVISPGSGTITFPDINLTVYNDLTISAITGTGKAAISNTATGIGNIDVLHDLIIAGALQYQNGLARTINVTNLLNIQSAGSFSVAATGTVVTNLLNLNGGMINNGTFNMNDATRICDVTFLGTSNNTITGTGATTDFNRLIVNKGTTQTPLLEVNLSNFSLSAATTSAAKALDLQNGTFKLSSSQTLVISSGNNGSDYFIPYTAQLFLNGGNLRITTTGTGAGLLLGGKLKIDAGTFYIEGGGTSDNYIEVAGGGDSFIEVNGGELRVGSQVRRANTSTISALSYIQTGGTVTIGTQSAPNSNRSLLEVLNDGSLFGMTGGTLIIARQQSGTPTIASLYLQPSTSYTTGGTIQMGSALYTPVGQNMQMYSSIPLYDLTINSTNAPIVSLTVGDLTIKNTFTIGASSSFVANDFDLLLQGNFVVNGTYTPGANTTYFSGAAVDQVLSGSGTVTFNNLNIANTKSSGIVSVTGVNVVVNQTLNINTGTLFDNGRTITVKQRVNNYSSHTSTGAGKMIFNGTAQQILSGNGQGIFGNVEINNANGLLLETNQTINGTLTFMSGIMDIRSTHLTLGQSATIGGSPNALNMIRTNGTLSDQGVTKNFASGAFNFTFPLGTSSKYTPVQYTATANGAVGTITVKPVNRKHPSVTVGFDALDYYWNVSSTGFSGLTVQHIYTYNNEDINGNENLYDAARFFGNWTKGTGVGTITAVSNLITIDGGATGVNYISGDYTAGNPSAFQSVQSFVSAQSGNWDVGATWIGGVVPSAGAPVIIDATHQVTLSTAFVAAPNSKNTFSLEVRSGAKLLIANATFGHNFGNVLGSGTLSLSSGIFPGGAYDQFVNNSGGTVEYTGTGYALSTQLFYNNVVVNATGSIMLPNADITLRGNLTIASGTLDNSANNRKISLQGIWTNNVSASAYAAGSGTVEFIGAAPQTIGGSAETNFATLAVNKSANSVTLNTDIQVANGLTFVQGNIVTGSFKVIGGASSIVTRSSGHIVGNFMRNVSTSSTTFPVGTAASYLPLTISFSTGSTDVTVFVEGVNPVTAKGPGTVTNPLLAMWSIEPTAFPVSAVASTIFQYPDNVRQPSFNQSQAFAARWDAVGSAWESYRLKSVASPDEDPSRVVVTGITDFSSWAIFSGSDDTPLPIELVDFAGQFRGTHVSLTWVTATEKDNDYFVIQKSTDGLSFYDLGKIASKGNTQKRQYYQFLDHELANGIVYYRLHQVDLDGTKTYFDVIAVMIESGEQVKNFLVYPNPSVDEVFVKRLDTSSDVAVSITDVTGKLLMTNHYENLNSMDALRLDVESLSAGTYFIKLVTEKHIEVHKIVLR